MTRPGILCGRHHKTCQTGERIQDRQRTCRLSGYITLHTEQLERPQQHRLPPAAGQPGRRGLQLAADGKGSPAHHSKFCDNDLVQGEVEILHTPKTADPMDDRSVTLYDISAAANLKTLLADRPQYALGRIVIPNIPVCDGAVYVSGDSMYPILKSGDIVGFKSIRDFTDVIYGEMYLVSFERGGDEYLAVKYVNHSERPDCIRLVSYNNHHDPMDLPLAAVNAMAIVKFSIRKNMMM